MLCLIKVLNGLVLHRRNSNFGKVWRRWQNQVSIWSLPETRFHHGWWVSCVKWWKMFERSQNFSMCSNGKSCVLPDDSLYSATSVNFLGTEPIFARTSPPMRTEFTNYWLNGKERLRQCLKGWLKPGQYRCFSYSRTQFCIHGSDPRE